MRFVSLKHQSVGVIAVTIWKWIVGEISRPGIGTIISAYPGVTSEPASPCILFFIFVIIGGDCKAAGLRWCRQYALHCAMLMILERFAPVSHIIPRNSGSKSSDLLVMHVGNFF